VENTKSPNIVSLPYQPQSELKHSLSAADVHLVSVGDQIPGIVHPSKVYGAMAVARPIFLIGPEKSHVSDILDEHDIGLACTAWRCRRSGASVARKLPPRRRGVGRERPRAHEVISAMGGKAEACARVCDVLERGV
jgi:hypothetical protein